MFLRNRYITAAYAGPRKCVLMSLGHKYISVAYTYVHRGRKMNVDTIFFVLGRELPAEWPMSNGDEIPGTSSFWSETVN